MENKRKVTFGGIWRSLYPALLYMVLQILVSIVYAVSLSVGNMLGKISDSQFDELYDSGLVTIVLISAILGSLLFAWLYYRDEQKRKVPYSWYELERSTPSEGQLLWVLIGSAGLALFGNNLINLTPMAQWSDNYQDTSEALYEGSIWLRMASVGFFAPLVEELLMRGLLYQRLREMLDVKYAMFWSSLVFAFIHGNIVQGMYAFLIGLFFAWLMERFQGILAPVLAHMSANLFVLILVDSSALEVIYAKFSSFLLSTILSGAVFLCACYSLKNLEN